MKNLLLSSIVTASLILSGCGTSSTTDATSDLITGQLVDSYLENVDYVCADGKTGLTDGNGTFSCETLPVEFKLGELSLGSISQITEDTQVFPQDLAGVAREDINNTKVVAMAILLQSCDDDNNSENGIKVRAEVKNAFLEAQFNENDITAYANQVGISLKDEQSAKEHLARTTTFVKAVKGMDGLSGAVTNAILSPKNTLTQEALNTLSYIGNEERLAYDVYRKLYAIHDANGVEIKPLTNIPNMAEIKHIQAVQLLVKKYVESESNFTNIDMTELSYKDTNVSEMSAGVYDIQAIQDHYDRLIEKGTVSKQAALEVGCEIEVIDIVDLNAKIITAQESNASDIVEVFNFLRTGSYSHYWSFDKALKNIDTSLGCSTFKEELDSGTPEYPQPETGGTGGNGGH